MPITIRPAALSDLDAIVGLTRQRRRELAGWEPVYWNPRVGADDLHPLFLRYCVDEATIPVHVAVDVGEVVGCGILQPQHQQWFLDDLCVLDDRWSDVGEALAASFEVSPTILCCPRRDIQESTWLAHRGAFRISEYHAIDLRSWADRDDLAWIRSDSTVRPHLPTHTFMKGHLESTTAGALVLHGEAGDLIGTPPISPPTHDPGGPTTVIDCVNGPNREQLFRCAIEACRTRGDAQLIVVCATEDD